MGVEVTRQAELKNQFSNGDSYETRNHCYITSYAYPSSCSKGGRGGHSSGGGHSGHSATGSSHSKTHVKSYTKKNGTKVDPHNRSSKDGTVDNNWSTQGNVNPDTGKPGTK